MTTGRIDAVAENGLLGKRQGYPWCFGRWEAGLGWPEGDTRGSVTELNEADDNGVTQIVGWSSPEEIPTQSAIRWEVASVAGVPILVSGPSDLAAYAAYGINSFGDIVGESGAWPFLKPAGLGLGISEEDPE